MARRFNQIAVTERQLQATLASIAHCKAHMKELREERDGLIAALRAAARDEGKLPLFATLDEEEEEEPTEHWKPGAPDAAPGDHLYAADDPLVLNGTYDRDGYKPGERERIEKAKARQQPTPVQEEAAP